MDVQQKDGMNSFIPHNQNSLLQHDHNDDDDDDGSI
jgi:hypothetical protein